MTFTSIRKVLAAATLLATVVMGSVAPEAAAGPNLQFCLTNQSGGAWVANWPVRLYTWDGAKAVHIRNGKTGAGGCGTFYGLAGNQYYFVDGYYEWMTPNEYSSGGNVSAYLGSTPWVVLPNSQGTYRTPNAAMQGPHWMR